MYNVQTKIFALLTLLFLSACSASNDNGSAQNPDSAEGLVTRIQQSLTDHKYHEALDLIDSLNLKYPDKIELRKTTLLSRAEAMAGIVRDSIPMVDTLLISTQLEIDSLKTFFVKVNEKGLPPYEVDKSVRNVNILSGNVVQPRLGDEAQPWSVNLGILGKRGIESLEYDGIYITLKNAADRSVKTANGEIITIEGHEFTPIVERMEQQANEASTLTVITSQGDVKIKLTPQVQQAIVRTAKLARSKEQNRLMRVKRELLERKLIVAENQIANFQNTK